MPTFRPLRSRAVASIAAAFALLASGTAAAQDGGYTPSDEDSLLLQMQVKGHRLANDLRGYQTPDGVCVDLADVIQSLDLPVRLDKKSRRATGWLFAESQTLTIDRDSNTVQIVNNRRAIQPGELFDTPEGWCIDTRTLGGWMGVILTPQLRDSSLILTTDREIPFIEAMERQSRAARLRPERQTRDLTGYPVAQQPYSLWRLPSVDVVAQADYRSSGGRGRLNTKYEVFASGELAMASFDMRLASNAQGVPDSLRVRAYRKDPDGGLLGPLRATQVLAGDVEILSGELAGAPGVGRGVFLSNRSLQQSDRFGTTFLRGTLPLGWDAELYRNGQLLAFQSNRPDGRYEFEVNLLFGANELEVVLYGPQGQVRRETESLRIGDGALRPGKLEYWAGVIERDHDLISFGRPPPGQEGGWQYAAGVQYGLDRRTAIGANAHSLLLDGRRRNYAELNVQRSLASMLVNLSAAQELGRGRAYRADLLGKFGPFNIQAQSFFADGDFTSGLVSDNERSSHNLQVDTMVKLGKWPMPISAGLRRTTRRDGREVNEFLARASLLRPRFSLTGFIGYRDTQGFDAIDDGMRVGLLANTRFLGVSARGEASYRLTGRGKGFESANLTLEKALSDRSDLRLEVEHDRRQGRTEFDLGYVRHFRQLAVRAGARADTNGGIGATLAVSFSLGPDPLGGGIRMSSAKLAQRGHAAVAVFLDENGDGIRSPGDEAIEGVTVTAGRGGASEPSNEQGHAFVAGLQPYEKVLLSVDESTLPDPFLMPRGKGVVVTPRPGVAMVIEIAVSPTGEVEGVVNGPEGTALPGVRVELVDAAGEVMARTMSEYDGFFLFDRVAYGRYRLQLAPESQAALGVAPDLAAGVEVNAEKTVARVGTIRLRAATTIAQATGPPEDPSP
jgi:hypothetical protein